MPVIEWSDQYKLGVQQMDDTHREFMDLLNAAADASDEEFPPLFAGFIEHTEAHFAQENRWMQELGFAADHCHTGEHEHVLKVLHAVNKRLVEVNDLALGRRMVSELPQWFDNHAATMDSALAHYLKEEAEPGCMGEAEPGCCGK